MKTLLVKNIKLIPPTYDFMFKAIMLEYTLRDFLVFIINYVTKISKKELENIIIQNTEHLVTNKNDKKMVSDIIISINKFTINIEMNRCNYKGLLIRNNRYLYKIVSNLDNTDDSYKDYKKCIQINFDNFSLFKNKQDIHMFVTKDMKTNEVLKDDNIKYHIDMDFMYKRCHNKHISNLNLFERSILMFKAKTSDELIKLAGDDDMLKRLASKIINLSKDKKMIGLYDAKKEEEKIQNTIRYYAEMDGESKVFSKGISQGKNNEKLAIAKKMLSKKINVNDISDITGLSLQEIKNLN